MADIATPGSGVCGTASGLDHPGTVRRLALCNAASGADEHGKRDLLLLVELEAEGRSRARLGSRLIAHGSRARACSCFPVAGISPRCGIRARSRLSQPSSPNRPR
jgi:hypothetical protein